MRNISYSEVIITLKYEVSPENYDVEDFNKILENIKIKQEGLEATDWDNLRNPFKTDKAEYFPSKVPSLPSNPDLNSPGPQVR